MVDEERRRSRRRSSRSARDFVSSNSGGAGGGVASTGASSGGGVPGGTVCSVRSCGAQAAGTGARSAQPLCARHMAEDAARLAEQRASAQRRLRALLGDTAAVNGELAAAERQALVAELTATEQAFESAQACLVRWHETLIGLLARRLEAATRDDSDAAAAQQYEREIADEERAGGGGQRVFELLTQLELLLTGMEERRGRGGRRFFPPSGCSPEDEVDPCTNPRPLSTKPPPPFVGDVSGRVRELQFVISRHLAGSETMCDSEVDDQRRLQQMQPPTIECESGGCGSQAACESGGNRDCNGQRRNQARCRKTGSPRRVKIPTLVPPCRLAGCASDLGGQPLHLAVCVNTAGYGADPTGRVTRWDEPLPQSDGANAAASNSAANADISGGGLVQLQQHLRLPEPCVFVAFEPEERKDHLLLVPLDCLGQGGAPRLRCHCALDWRREVRGLHCDSAAQLLYIAQDAAVSVADLSGRLVRVIGGGLGCLTGLDGDPESAFAFDRQARRLLVVDKAAGGLRAAFPADSFHGGGHDKLAVLGNKVLLTDWRSGRIHKMCASSGRLVATYPNNRTGREVFCGPACVAADASGSGLIFVSECERRLVHVLSGDGALLQSLGTDCCFCIPWGLAVADMGTGRRQLVVADNGNQRLLLFELI